MQANLPKFDIAIIAYCLMPNHYHLLLRQNGETCISDLIQVVFRRYSIHFNVCHHHSGTIFEGPFRAILVNSNEHLPHMSRYTHRNPVEANLVTRPEWWQYSNYKEFIGKRADHLFEQEFFHLNFDASAVYEEFVCAYDPPEKFKKELRHYFWDFEERCVEPDAEGRSV